MPMFRIRTRRVPDLDAFHGGEQSGETYLGPFGVHTPEESAVRFRSQHAAERALIDAWNRLRNAGNRSIILSVVPAKRQGPKTGA